jgi:hypothetical protein
MTASPPTIGDTLCYSGSQYSNIELDFGAPNSGGNYPWLPQLPSLTQKGYTNPAEQPGNGGAQYGVVITVTAAFNTLTSINFEVCTSSTASALVGSSPNPIAARTLTLAQLQVIGARYWIPVSGFQVLEFLRVYAAITGSNPTLGAVTMYWGPIEGGLL